MNIGGLRSFKVWKRGVERGYGCGEDGIWMRKVGESKIKKIKEREWGKKMIVNGGKVIIEKWRNMEKMVKINIGG